jgi:hypothetical protein
VLARLDDEGLDRLERQLTLLVSQLEPGTFRDASDVLDEPDRVEIPGERELREAALDLLNTAHEGVEIRPQTESRPLIPLYEASGMSIPAEIRVDHERNGYDYYLVEVGFAAMLSTDQRPLSAQFGLVLADDIADAARRVRPTRVFPGREDVQLFNVDFEGSVGLDAAGKVKVPTVNGQLLSASATAEARIKTGIVVGPLSFPFRKAKIEVVGEYGQDVTWRYNLKSALWGTNVFKSILILKVASEAREVKAGAALTLTPYKRRWIAFKERLPVLKSDPVEVAIELSGKENR